MNEPDKIKGMSLADIAPEALKSGIAKMDPDDHVTMTSENADLFMEMEHRWDRIFQTWQGKFRKAYAGNIDPELRSLMNRVVAQRSIYIRKGKYQMFELAMTEYERRYTELYPLDQLVI